MDLQTERHHSCFRPDTKSPAHPMFALKVVNIQKFSRVNSDQLLGKIIFSEAEICVGGLETVKKQVDSVWLEPLEGGGRQQTVGWKSLWI